MLVETIAEGFPLIATLAVLIVLVLLLRAKTQRSAGATDAGPVEPERAKVPGLSATAQDLRSIERDLAERPNETIQMLQAMCRERGIDDTAHGTATPPIELLVHRLEEHLELTPRSPS